MPWYVRPVDFPLPLAVTLLNRYKQINALQGKTLAPSAMLCAWQAYVAHSPRRCGGRTPDKVRYGRRLRLPTSLMENCRLRLNRFKGTTTHEDMINERNQEQPSYEFWLLVLPGGL